MRDFCNTYNLQNIIKEPTCFKSVENPKTIDLILTNRYTSFHTSIAIETGISGISQNDGNSPENVF